MCTNSCITPIGASVRPRLEDILAGTARSTWQSPCDGLGVFFVGRGTGFGAGKVWGRYGVRYTSLWGIKRRALIPRICLDGNTI